MKTRPGADVTEGDSIRFVAELLKKKRNHNKNKANKGNKKPTTRIIPIG